MTKQTDILFTGITAVSTSAAKPRAGVLWNYLLKVDGTGAVAASAVVEVSYDGVLWVEWGTLDAAGTTSAFDTLAPANGSYPMHRGRVTAISGTGAQAELIGCGE